MLELPTGIVTLLMADIQNCGQLLATSPVEMQAALSCYKAILRQAIVSQGGCVYQAAGDAFCASFITTQAAVAAAVWVQREMRRVTWAEPRPLPVRQALLTGPVSVCGNVYVGSTVNHAIRLLRLGHAGQILLSSRAGPPLHDGALDGIELRYLGEIGLQDLVSSDPVYLVIHPDLPIELVPLESMRDLPHNLPVDLSSFVGRERAIDEIEQYLAARRLVTLTGAGGIGKTRLALQVAGDMLGVVGHGVWLVELAGVSDSSLVLQAVISALSLREEPGRPLLDTLVDYLRPKQVLLVMDYCEHLLEGCARLSQVLLEACPSLSILATSREPFEIAQEVPVSVASLPLPDLERLPLSDKGLVPTLTEYESVRLLKERARAAQPGFELTSENALAVAQICRRLDGIPLAIELVAACTAHFSVEQIAERLGDHFQLLTGGRHVALPRDRTLRAVIGWSYSQLSESEQMLLRRLAVFMGGWAVEAAEVVCWGRGLETDRVADLLSQLAAKSFVIVDRQGGFERYHMLETIRQYGRDRLLDAGETGWVQGRLLDFFLRLAEQAESRLQSVEQAAWLERLQVEYDNLRAALEWGQAARSSAEAGLRLAGALWGFWFGRGQWSEGRLWLESALMGTAGGSSVRAKAFNAAGHIAFAQGDLMTAQLFYEEALAIRRGVGDKRGVVESLRSLSRLARSLGNLSQAFNLAEEGWAVSNELGNNETVAASLYELASVLEQQGQMQKAASLFRESLSLWLGINNTMRMAGCLTGLSAVFLKAGQPEGVMKAARLLGAASALFDTIGAPLIVSGRAEYDQSLAAAKSLLDESAFAQAWSEGRGMTREQVITYALEV